MKKQLPTAGIANELSGALAFFPKQPIQPISEHSIETGGAVQPEPPATHQLESLAQQTKSENTQDKANVRPTTAQHPPILAASHHATTPPNNQTEPFGKGQTAVPSHNHDLMPPATLEQIRKVVKQVGKEAATYRLTQSEKQQLADIVYTYKRRGYRTSDNELARIALNWLTLDYQEQGEQSMLARVLETLHR
jgi:hypothetical protein